MLHVFSKRVPLAGMLTEMGLWSTICFNKLYNDIIGGLDALFND
jgi:hypothetical protein